MHALDSCCSYLLSFAFASSVSRLHLHITCLNFGIVSIRNGRKTSEVRHSMPCIKVLEVAYLCGYLVVSARVHTPNSGLILAYFSVTPYHWYSQVPNARTGIQGAGKLIWHSCHIPNRLSTPSSYVHCFGLKVSTKSLVKYRDCLPPCSWHVLIISNSLQLLSLFVSTWVNIIRAYGGKASLLAI
jgi:hypothetical protein